MSWIWHVKLREKIIEKKNQNLFFGSTTASLLPPQSVSVVQNSWNLCQRLHFPSFELNFNHSLSNWFPITRSFCKKFCITDAIQRRLAKFSTKKGFFLFNWTVLMRRPKTVSVYSNSILFDSSFQKLRILNCLFRHCATFVCLNCWKSSIFEWNSSNYDLNLNKSL